MNVLGKLIKVDLRKAWVHEAYDFTTWLSLEENLATLSEEIGVEIKLIQTEAGVGTFNVDILAEEESTGRKIIIENQLEQTNHDHLGKVITYAAGHEAGIVIWIVSGVREEHRRAVDWLNEHTDSDVNFFLVKMELWQIGDSPAAPKFQIESKPNEWAKAIRTSSSSGELSNTQVRQLDFWTKFKSYVAEKDSRMRLQTPRPQHWYDVSFGTSDAHITLTLNSRENRIGCEIYINKNKELFNFLKTNREVMETAVNAPLDWIDASVASRIRAFNSVDSVFDESKYEEYFLWLYEKTALFQKVFSKYLREYKNYSKSLDA